MRKAHIVWFILAAICGAILFHTSQRVTDGRDQVAARVRDIAKERESIRVLEAEWSYLNQPDRLEKLARQHLHLEPMKGKQFTAASSLDALPVFVPAEAARTETAKTEDDETEADATAVATEKDAAAVVAAAPPPVKPAPVVRILKPASPPALTAALPAPRPVLADQRPVPPLHKTAEKSAPSRGFGDLMKSLGAE